MNICATPLEIEDVLLVETRRFQDLRGFFMETFHVEKYAEAGIVADFVQDNRSRSVHGALRGMHYQVNRPQAKLVMALDGEIFDVAVDIRKGSPTFGKWCGAVLSGENGWQMWVPEGFAHGFCVLSESADVLYKCTDLYSPGDERAILWSDPDMGIAWPLGKPLLSPKDAAAPMLAELGEDDLFRYGGKGV
ncbi:MAG: dTDP-4-dehydrorhamnose 3,5-epimerase [Desulfatibacillaceae bacterium]